MSDTRAPVVVSCLLLEAGDRCWLAPTALVAEVIAHFGDLAPLGLSWRGLQIPCLDDTSGRLRALAVLRRLADGQRGFYALALREAPRPVQVRADMLVTPNHDRFEIDGRLARVLDAAALEARLPAN